MLIIPAIDLKEGRCVRLLQGRFDQETIYGHDPAAMARNWEQAGAAWIHIVDLDGSVGRQPKNSGAILSIRSAVKCRLQVGGGIRSLDTISFYLERGIDRVILGTAAHQNSALIREAADLYPGRIVIGLDARGSQLLVQGWTEETGQNIFDLARKFKAANVAAIIYTDVDRDGMRTGPNLERTRALAQAAHVPVIASGGVKDLEDIRNLLPLAKYGVSGVITGKALYEGSLDYRQALKLAAEKIM